ncbi:hypothetical protein [Burkholderia sp. LMU1-1-1.1]|uniref:hypothetical protein n=1 Tax=Burkholderia sp. LMU1-1-1.1 TaxID=3135266 RepID=UPI00342BD5B6
MKKIFTAFFIYFAFCSFMAFIDFDWNAENEYTVKDSIQKQILYMNLDQKKAYFVDLDAIDSAGMMGGMNGKLLHGKEVNDIHELANKIRQKRGKEIVDFPSKSFSEAVSDFFKIPLAILMSRS